jgi:hypothetical protein
MAQRSDLQLLTRFRQWIAAHPALAATMLSCATLMAGIFFHRLAVALEDR